MPEEKLYSVSLIKQYLKDLRNHIKEICKSEHGGANEYALLYYEGKIDALESILKDGKNMCKLDEGFGL